MGEQGESKGFFRRLFDGLAKTRNSIVSGIDAVFGGFSSIDEDFYEEIEEILRLGEIVQKNIKRNPRGSARVRSESEFHGAIMKAAHNDFLAQFIPLLTETIEKTFALDENLEIIAEDAYKDHIMIMHFLELRDAAALKSAVTIHLHHAAINENLKLDI